MTHGLGNNSFARSVPVCVCVQHIGILLKIKLNLTTTKKPVTHRWNHLPGGGGKGE